MSECRVSTCDRPAGDAFVCQTCGDHLHRALAETPWLIDELNIVITKQAKYTTGGSAATIGKTQPLPYDIRASDALNRLAYLLGSWTRMFCEENPGWIMPKPDPGSLSRWLMVRVNDIRHHAAGNDCIEELADAYRTARWAVDRPADKSFVGLCVKLTDEIECGAGVYAVGRKKLAKCSKRGCGAEYEAETSRRGLEEALDDLLVTAAELADMATYLGLPADRERVRKQINLWHTRGRLTPRINHGETVFRYGEVRPMLYTAFGTSDH